MINYLTTPNPEFNEDKEMFNILGLIPKEPFQEGEKPVSQPDAIIEEKKKKRCGATARP